jgi:hypothetical protein
MSLHFDLHNFDFQIERFQILSWATLRQMWYMFQGWDKISEFWRVVYGYVNKKDDFISLVHIFYCEAELSCFEFS